MAAGLSNVIESLDLAMLMELMAQGYELNPEEKPSVLQYFEREVFNAEVEDDLDPSTFSETFNQKLDILFHIYQQDPEVLQYLSPLRSKWFNEESIPLNSGAPISEAEQAMLEQAIALSLADREGELSKIEFEIPFSWQEGVTIRKYLLDIFSARIAEAATKGDIDRRKLALLLPRIFTPNQDLVRSGENGPEILDQQYAARIPGNILKQLELLSQRILSIVNTDVMPLSEKIVNISFLYQLYEKELRAEVEKFFSDNNETSDFINILLREVKLSEEDKKIFTREFIRLQIINTYMLMCFQFMNVKIQYRISEQSYKYKDIIVASIGFIGQQLQVLTNKETLAQAVMNKLNGHLVVEKENKLGGWKDLNGMTEKKILDKELRENVDELSKFLHSQAKYEPIIKVLRTISKTDDYNQYCIELIMLLQGILPSSSDSKIAFGDKKGKTEFPKKMLSWLPGFDENLRKKAAGIIHGDKEVQDYIHKAAAVVNRIKSLESECAKQAAAYDDALKQISAAATEISAPISPPMHSAPATVAANALRLGGYRVREGIAQASSISASSASASAASSSVAPAFVNTAPVQHSAPAATRLDSAGAHRRYAFVGHTSESVPPAPIISDNSDAEVKYTPQ